jgi:acetyltransferase-like isoleucine patch superfamily enzyme
MLRFKAHLPKIQLKLLKIKYGKNLKMIGWPFIFKFPDANLEIGDDCRINSSFLSNLLGIYQRSIIIAKGKSNIKIGNRVGISGTTIYAWEDIEIGDDTIIGANTKIFDTDFHPLDANDRLHGDISSVLKKKVVIGKNVFIGCNCLILKGTVLEDHCVVGAGSVVTGFHEKGSVIAGNPARRIR